MPGVHNMETNQLVGKSPTIPYTPGGTFSLGIGSMSQSKIAVGNKKMLPFASGLQNDVFCSLRYISREEFLLMQQDSFEGLNLKEGRVSKPYKVVN